MSHEANCLTAYDEEDDGFAFTRTRSKKAKSTPLEPPISEDLTARPSEPATQRKPKKRLDDRNNVAEARHDTTKGTPRSTRNSGGELKEADPPQLVVKKRRKKGSDESMPHPEVDMDHVRAQTNIESQQDDTHPIQIDSDSTKIALPFADTPIIRRNKEMRRDANSGSRRSSLGMRGRRASSLIDTGKSVGKAIYMLGVQGN